MDTTQATRSTTRLSLAIAAGFLVMFVVNALAAALVIGPLFNADYPQVTGDRPQFDWPQLIGGYAVIAAVIAVTYRTDPGRHGWMRSGLRHGCAIAIATFAGVHLVQAGYTAIDNTAWILSGLIDMAGPIAAGVVIAFLLGRTRR